ncbi:hypothetical protein BDZ97DRAFT_1789942 [Flammula alnicola]|nr:hypothetical protein BDZ97DRAFT_1789942 [Flammula alnicola]
MKPEAAAVHCAQLNDLHRLKPSQNFIICDMGGGIVDLAVYKFVLISADAIDNFNRSSVECIWYSFLTRSLSFFAANLSRACLRRSLSSVSPVERLWSAKRTSIIVDRIRVSPSTNGAVANRPIEFVALIYWTGVIIALCKIV